MSFTRPVMTLRVRDAVHQARLLRYEAPLLDVWVSPPLAPHERLEMRLDLPSMDTVIEGTVVVSTTSLQHAGGQHTTLRIVRMRPSCASLLQEWHGGQALCDDLPGPSPISRGPSRGPEVLVSTTTHRRSGEGRAAIRALFRSSPALGEARVEPQRAHEPEVLLALDPLMPSIEVRYDEASWRRDWNDWLSRGILHVRRPPPHPALDSTLEVRLARTSQPEMRCRGKVVNLHAHGFGLALELDADHGTAEDSCALWLQMFARAGCDDPLPSLLAVQPDPLEGLRGLEPDQRRQIDALLRDDDLDYLTMADRLAPLLACWRWRWPELETLIEDSPGRMEEAASYIVLAEVTRRQAIEAVRTARRDGLMLRLVPGNTSACSPCAKRCRLPLSPLAQVHAGLPPYHLGCSCELVPAAPRGSRSLPRPPRSQEL